MKELFAPISSKVILHAEFTHVVSDEVIIIIIIITP